MLAINRAGRRLMLAAALFIGSASLAQAAEEEAAGWWCYNGTCCRYSGGAVTQPCMFNCETGDGQRWVVSCSEA